MGIGIVAILIMFGGVGLGQEVASASEPSTVYFGYEAVTGGYESYAYFTSGTGYVRAEMYCSVDGGNKQFWVYGPWEGRNYISWTSPACADFNTIGWQWEA